MRKRVLSLVVLALLLMGGLGQAIRMFFPLSEHTIAKEISPNGMPLYRTYTFTFDDEQVVSWLLIWRDARCTAWSGDGTVQRAGHMPGLSAPYRQ